MTETRFTPGPWSLGWGGEANDWDNFSLDIGTLGRGGVCILIDRRVATIEDKSEAEKKEETLANADLIAVAPNLYVALENLIETCESEDVQEFGESPDRQIIREAKAVLTEARGVS